MKMRRTALVTGAWVFTAIGAWGTEAPDGFEVYLKQLGEGFRNCGRVASHAENRRAVDECVLQSFASREPFFVRYDQLGIDSNVAKGLLLERSKQLVILHFDDWSCKTPTCVAVERCESPRITKTKDGIRVECANVYQM